MTVARTIEQPSEDNFGRQSRIIAFVVAVSFFMQFLDGTIITTSLPQMAVSFGVEPVSMSIGITVYLLTMAAFVPLAGWAGDRYGARRVFLASIAIFTMASLFCGLSGNLTEFIIARAVQGLGSALMTPVGRIIVLRNARKSEIVAAIGLTIWPALFAPVLGPALGGFITEYISWHWNFWINIPLGIIGMVLVLAIVPKDTEYDDRPFDGIGFVLTGITLGCLLYGFDALVQGGLPVWLSALLIAVGLATGTAAVLWLLRAEHPLIDLRTLGIRTFAATDAKAGAILRTAINATPFLLPLMFQVAYGMDALSAGGLVVIYFFGNLAIKAVTTPTLRRFGFRSILTVNGVLAGVSVAACGLLGPQTPYLFTAAVLFVAGATRSMQFTALATLAFADVDMSQQLSMVFGVAIAAGCLNLSQMWRGAPTLRVIDFQVAYLVMGLIIIVCALQLLTLERNAGAEVSGHRRPQAA